MPRHYNHVELIGNLTREPDLETTSNGNSVVEFGLAINRNYQDGSGKWQEDTTFVDVTAWGNTAENVAEYLEKGSLCFIEGRLSFDSWEQDENSRSKLSVTAQKVIFLGASHSGESEYDENGEVETQESEQKDVPF